MGKVAVFLFAVVAVQAALGGVTRDRDEQGKLDNSVKQIWSISEDVSSELQKTHAVSGTQFREFETRVEDVINKFEELKHKNDAQVNAVVEKVLGDLHQVLSILKRLWNVTDPTAITNLKTALSSELKNTANRMELLVQTIEGKNTEVDIYTKIFTVFSRYSQGIQELQNKITAHVGTTVGETPRELVKKIEDASEELIRRIEEAQAAHGETEPIIREYIRDLAIVTERLERIGKSNSGDIRNLIESFRGVMIFLNKFANREGVTAERLRTILSNVPSTFGKLFENGYVHTTELRDVALEFVAITKRFRFGTLSDFHGRDEYHSNGRSAEQISRELGDSLKRITEDSASTKQNLLNLIRTYLDNLKESAIPELEQHARALAVLNANLPLNDIKERIYNFVASFKDGMEKMSQNVVEKFWQETRKLQDHFNNIDSSEHSRHLAIRIQTVADLLSNMLQTISIDSTNTKEGLVAQQREFAKSLERLLTGEKNAPRETTTVLKEIVGELEKDLDVYKFVASIQVATTELRKLWIVNNETYRGLLSGFLNIVQWQWRMLSDVYGKTQNIEQLTMHIEATTNKLGTYYNGERNTDEVKDLLEFLKRVVQKLEAEANPNEVKKIVNGLKVAVQQVESRSEINDFLQSIASEMKTLGWAVAERKDDFHNVVKDILMNYWVKLQKLHMGEKVEAALRIVQARPVEALVQIETAAERLGRILRLVVPDYKRTKFAFQKRHFVQLLEIVAFRLRQWGKQSVNTSSVVQEVYENLRKIQKELEEATPDLTLKTRLGVYVYNAVVAVKKLAVDTDRRDEEETQKLLRDFWFGLKHLQGQVQYNLQIATEEYSVKTLAMQVQIVANRLAVLLQRSQLKPELKSVIFTGIEVFGREVGYLVEFVQEIGGDKSFQSVITKLNKVYEEFDDIAKKGPNKSVVELTGFLDTYVQTVARDLEDISFTEQLQTPEFNQVYRRFLAGLGNLMVRLQNVHYFEYYSRLDARQIVDNVERITGSLTSKLSVDFSEDKEIKYDLTIHVLKFANRLNVIAERILLRTKVAPSNLLEIVQGLVQLARQTTGLSTNEIKSKLATYLKKGVEVIAQSKNERGTKDALASYLVSAEKLYIPIQHIWMRSQQGLTLRQAPLHVQTHVRYFTQVLERINPNYQEATEVLRSANRRLVETVSGVLAKLQTTSVHSTKLQTIVNVLSEIKSSETTNYRSLDELKINLSVQVQRASWALWDLVWVLNVERSTDLDQIVRTSLGDLLTIVQTTYIQIELQVLVSHNELGAYGVEQNREPWLAKKTIDYDTDRHEGRSFRNEDVEPWFTKKTDYNTARHEARLLKNEDAEPWFTKKTDQTLQVEPWSTKKTEQTLQNRFFQNEADSDKWARSEEGRETRNTFGYKTDSNKWTSSFGTNFDQEPENHLFSYKSTTKWPSKTKTLNNDHSQRPTWLKSEYTTTSSSNAYKTKISVENYQQLVSEIRRLVGEVSGNVRKYENKPDFGQYVRELVHIIENVLDHAEGTNDYFVQRVVKNLNNIRDELRQSTKSGVFHQVDQVKYEIVDGIERVWFDLERLTRFVKDGDVQVFKKVFNQFLNFIRNFKDQIEDNEHVQNGNSGTRSYNVPEYRTNIRDSVGQSANWRRPFGQL